MVCAASSASPTAACTSTLSQVDMTMAWPSPAARSRSRKPGTALSARNSASRVAALDDLWLAPTTRGRFAGPPITARYR